MEPVEPKLIQWIRERTKVGVKKYGQPLHTFNGRNSVRDVKEELLDALQYVQQWEMERTAVSKLLNEIYDYLLVTIYDDDERAPTKREASLLSRLKAYKEMWQ